MGDLLRKLEGNMFKFKFQICYYFVTINQGKSVWVCILCVFAVIKTKLLHLLFQLFNKYLLLRYNLSHTSLFHLNPFNFPLILLPLGVTFTDEPTDPREIPLKLLHCRCLLTDRVRQLDYLLVLLQQYRLVVTHQSLQLRIVLRL
jgi:hypothetical protein